MRGVATYIHQTDLSKRVQKWEERIKPLLVQEVCGYMCEYVCIMCGCVYSVLVCVYSV